jgi:TRAP-type mannitol/chloroaromatic compound transport system permease small subunit
MDTLASLAQGILCLVGLVALLFVALCDNAVTVAHFAYTDHPRAWRTARWYLLAALLLLGLALLPTLEHGGLFETWP